jgi:hypothetical protein
MPLNATREERRRVAKEDDAVKSFLAKGLVSDLSDFFEKVDKYIHRNYVVFGLVPTLQPYLIDFTNILYRHYKKTGKAFRNRLLLQAEAQEKVQLEYFKRRQVNSQIEAIEDNHITNRLQTIPQLILAHARDVYIRHYDKNAANILKEKAKIEQKKAQISIIVTGVNARDTREEIASVSAPRIWEIFEERMEQIGETEIEEVAEFMKLTEAGVLSLDDVEVGDVNFEKTNKEWVAILDDKTREDHADADGQIVGMEEDFTVGGDELAHPGDASRTTLDNVINCRCTVVYFVV